MGDLLDRTERLTQLTEKTEPLLSTPTQSRPPGDARALYLPRHTLDWTLDGVRVLERAFWLLQRYGWKQGVGDDTTKLTLDQAVRQAFEDMEAEGVLLQPRHTKDSALSALAGTIYFIDEDNGDVGPELEAFRSYIQDRPWGVVARYNDAPGRRQEDVFSVICDAIASGWKAHHSMWQHRRERALTEGTDYAMFDLNQKQES